MRSLVQLARNSSPSRWPSTSLPALRLLERAPLFLRRRAFSATLITHRPGDEFPPRCTSVQLTGNSGPSRCPSEPLAALRLLKRAPQFLRRRALPATPMTQPGGSEIFGPLHELLARCYASLPRDPAIGSPRLNGGLLRCSSSAGSAAPRLNSLFILILLLLACLGATSAAGRKKPQSQKPEPQKPPSEAELPTLAAKTKGLEKRSRLHRLLRRFAKGRDLSRVATAGRARPRPRVALFRRPDQRPRFPIRSGWIAGKSMKRSYCVSGG